MEQRTIYDWKPTICDKCQKYGHSIEECRKNKPKEIVKNTENNVTDYAGSKGVSKNTEVDETTAKGAGKMTEQ